MPGSETIVIADASPLVHLDRIKELDLLPALYGQVTIPATVAGEVTQCGPDWRGLPLAALPWIHVVPDPCDPEVAILPRLDPGEIAAITSPGASPDIA